MVVITLKEKLLEKRLPSLIHELAPVGLWTLGRR